MDEIAQSIGASLPQSEFRRVPLFYSLYCAIYHRLHGVPGVDLQAPRKALSRQARSRLLDTMEQLSELVSEKPDPSTTASSWGWTRSNLLGRLASR